MKSVEQELSVGMKKFNSWESNPNKPTLLYNTLQKVASMDRQVPPVPAFHHFFSDKSSKAEDKSSEKYVNGPTLDAEAYHKLENFMSLQRLDRQHRKSSDEFGTMQNERNMHNLGSPAHFKFNNFVEEKSQNGSAFGSADFNNYADFNNIFHEKASSQKPQVKDATKTTQISSNQNIGENSEEAKSPSKKKDLALRSDVMNKNIFRAFRRELKDTFEAYLSSVLYFNPKSKRNFLNNVRKFAEHLMALTNSANAPVTDFDKALLTKYLGILLNFCLMKKKFKESEDVKLVKDINTLLYSYSHRRFYDFLAIPEVKVIIKSVLEHVGVDDFVGKHESLSSHWREYTNHIKKMVRRL